VVQWLLNALAGTRPGAILRELLERATRRLRLLCASLLHRSYPRLTQGQLNLETDELLDGVESRKRVAFSQASSRPTAVST
jgi:hypothetical protein